MTNIAQPATAGKGPRAPLPRPARGCGLESDLIAIAEGADDIRAALRSGATGYARLAAAQVARTARGALRLIAADGGGR